MAETCSFCGRAKDDTLDYAEGHACIDCARALQDLLIAHDEVAEAQANPETPKPDRQLRFDDKFKQTIRKQFVDHLSIWQEVPMGPLTPGEGKFRNLYDLCRKMPWLATEDGRQRATARREVLGDELAMLNWWFYSGGTVEELRLFQSDLTAAPETA